VFTGLSVSERPASFFDSQIEVAAHEARLAAVAHSLHVSTAAEPPVDVAAAVVLNGTRRLLSST